MTRQECIDLLCADDELLAFIDGCDDAIIGVVYDPPRVAYNHEKIIEVLCEDMSISEAVEFYEFNIERSFPYLGNTASVIVRT